MSALRPLRGGCQCGRNRYIIAIPQDEVNHAQVLFNTEPSHQLPIGSPLAAYLRVPLTWYHSTTYAFFPDETHTMIRRVYEHPNHELSKRHFCGFCGTPLSYWSESPHSESEFIHLTLGSLLQEDVMDLEDMGIMRDQEGTESQDMSDSPVPPPASDEVVSTPDRNVVLRQSFGVPWFDSLVEGTRLGNMRRRQGIEKSQDGKVRVEWEIVEYSDGSSEDVDMGSTSSAKRKLDEREDVEL